MCNYSRFDASQVSQLVLQTLKLYDACALISYDLLGINRDSIDLWELNWEICWLSFSWRCCSGIMDNEGINSAWNIDVDGCLQIRSAYYLLNGETHYSFLLRILQHCGMVGT